MHAGEGFALFAHDFGGSEIKGIHFQLVVFREWDGVIEFTGFDVTLTEVHFRPFDFEQASAVFLHMCFAVEGEFHGFAPAVGMRGDEGADEFGVLLDQGVPLGFLADTEHFGDVRCHFHSDTIFRRESGNGGCLGNGKGMPVEWLKHYNYERPHQGYRNMGRRPIETIEAFKNQLKTIRKED